MAISAVVAAAGAAVEVVDGVSIADVANDVDTRAGGGGVCSDVGVGVDLRGEWATLSIMLCCGCWTFASSADDGVAFVERPMMLLVDGDTGNAGN